MALEYYKICAGLQRNEFSSWYNFPFLKYIHACNNMYSDVNYMLGTEDSMEHKTKSLLPWNFRSGGRRHSMSQQIRV